jgi:MFS family permease
MNRKKLFIASCVALVNTSMVFSIRGDVLDALGRDFHLNNQQLGILLSPAFWGFTLSIMIGGAMADFFGMKNLLLVSSAGYILAPLAIIFAPRPEGPAAVFYQDPGFITIYAGMLALGLCQGLVEGAINPLTATMYPDEKTHQLSILHAWWPGGLVIGGLAAYGLTLAMGLQGAGVDPATATLGWQLKVALLVLPAIVFGIMILREEFPETERVQAGVSTGAMAREALRPMFVLWFVCMWLTAGAELAPDQWVGSLITNLTGMSGILILVYTAGIMFVLRHFGGALAHKFSPVGLLLIASVLTAAGLYGLSMVRTPVQAFAAATLFGIGKTFFWPTMLGVTSERFPKGGALLLAIMGGAGNLAVAFLLPAIGRWYDAYGAATAFRMVAVLPLILVAIFGALLVYYKSIGGYKAIKLESR